MNRRVWMVSLFMALGLLAAACNTSTSTTVDEASACNPSEGEVSGSVNVDGSSTVFPITQAVAEECKDAGASELDVAVGTTGTGGGFKRFCAGETDISDASRPIKAEEIQLCADNAVEYVELHIAIDGLSVVTSSKNDFAEDLTIEELKKIFQPGSTIKNWSQIRAGFPNRELRLFSPGTDSGTFDYFTAEIVGEEGASRNDQEIISFSESDDFLVTGVSRNDGSGNTPLGLGYFGFAYYEQNQSTLKALAVDAGEGPIDPNRETINSGQYAPLSRPLFIYVSKKASARAEVQAFVHFYLDNVSRVVGDVGYIEVPEEVLDEERQEWAEFIA